MLQALTIHLQRAVLRRITSWNISFLQSSVGRCLVEPVRIRSARGRKGHFLHFSKVRGYGQPGFRSLHAKG
jgi:hypothetical protein